MSNESVESQAVKPDYLVFILAIAGRLDAHFHIDLKKVDVKSLVQYGYAALDSLGSSYSMFKYFFDVFSSNNDSDYLHDVMLSPVGIVAITIETLFLVSFSVLAVHFEKEKQDQLKKFIATAWPYFRDVMKGMKNAYKGLRSTFLAVALLGGTDFKYLATPLGLVLGVFAAINRVLLRKMQDIRKQRRIFNIERLLEFKKLGYLTSQERLSYFRKLALSKESREERRWAYASVIAGSLIDSLYLYVGVLGLASMCPPLLIAMTVSCVVFTIACVLTRLYEENEQQRDLAISRLKCKLTLLTKELESLYSDLVLLRQKSNKSVSDCVEIKSIELKIALLIEQYELKREKLKHQLTRSYFSAALYGMRSGLYSFNALASVLFLIGSIYFIVGVAFPPWFVLSFVAAGLASMVCLSIHSLITHYQHQKRLQENEARSDEQFTTLKEQFLQRKTAAEPVNQNVFRETLENGLVIERSPQYFFQEGFEVFRSFFSGLGKGQRFVDFAGNFLQEQNDNGHYQDTPIMYILSVFSALFFGAILALRAWFKGFDNQKISQPKTATEKKSGPEQSQPASGVSLETSPSGESSQVEKTKTDSLKTATKHAFFKPAPEPQQTPNTCCNYDEKPEASTETVEPEESSLGSTILGLT